MTAFIVLLAFTALLTAFYIFHKIRHGGILSTFAKTAASLGFVAAGVCALTLNACTESAVLCFGLILGMVGDVLIDLYSAEDEKTGPFLFAGFSLFGLEHIAVIVSVTMATGFSLVSFLISIAAGVLLSFGFITLAKKKLGFQFGDFLYPCLIYASLLAFCAIYYFAAALSNTRCFTLFGGMVMFLISDAVLSFILFRKKNTDANIAVNLITYYAGQILFALTIAFAY